MVDLDTLSTSDVLDEPDVRAIATAIHAADDQVSDGARAVDETIWPSCVERLQRVQQYLALALQELNQLDGDAEDDLEAMKGAQADQRDDDAL